MKESELEDLVESITQKLPDLKLGVADLKAPTTRIVRTYYLRVLQEFNVDVENLQHPVNVDPDHVLSADMNVFFALRSKFKKISLDFTFTDLIDPKPHRTQLLMRGLDNFHNIADWKASALREHVDKLLERKERYEQLRMERDAIQKNLDTNAETKAQRKLKMSEAKEEIRVLRQEIEKRKKNKIPNPELSHLKAEVQEEARNVEKLEKECQKLEEEGSRLKACIVQSPTQQLATLNSLRNRMAECEKEEQEMAQAMQEKGRQKEVYRACVDLQDRMNASLDEFLVQHEIRRRLETKLAQLKEKKNMQDCEKEDVLAKTKKLQIKLSQLQEEKKKASALWEEKKTKLEEELLEATRLHSIAKKEGEQSMIRNNSLQQELVSLEEESILLDSLIEKKNQEYQEEYAKMKSRHAAALEKHEKARTELYEEIKKMKYGGC